MDNGWSPVEGDEFTDLLNSVSPIGGKYPIVRDTTQIGKRRLPFYATATVELLRVKDLAWQPRNLFIYYLRHGGQFFWLNGTSPPIHEINKIAPIELNEDNLIDYLVFFCFFVRGEEGPFLVAQSMGDTYVPRLVDERTRAVLENTVRPAFTGGRDKDGNWLCDATIYYSNAIFESRFKVHPNGMIEMESDEPIAADLPVKIDAPIA